MNRQKEQLYLLVIILKDLISYKEEIINLEMELIIIKFNILLLKNNKRVLGIP